MTAAPPAPPMSMRRRRQRRAAAERRGPRAQGAHHHAAKPGRTVSGRSGPPFRRRRRPTSPDHAPANGNGPPEGPAPDHSEVLARRWKWTAPGLRARAPANDQSAPAAPDRALTAPSTPARPNRRSRSASRTRPRPPHALEPPRRRRPRLPRRSPRSKSRLARRSCWRISCQFFQRLCFLVAAHGQNGRGRQVSPVKGLEVALDQQRRWSRARYSSRRISIAPRLSRCGVTNCASSRR